LTGRPGNGERTCRVRNLIIGTSGHVDHGKTEIVKALTGRDTDRLKEEKERGISIVLGFAPLDLGDGVVAGIVDVPGHERFVKTMVSGAVGVDLALLVVAADEGIMPQTEEHFEVLRLLGVKGAVVAITKADLVDGELLELVEREIRDFLKGSVFDGSPIIRTSAVTGEGLAELKTTLKVQALALGERRSADFFRMPVDRVWTKSGIGTIVTGTAWSGVVKRGAELALEPGGRSVRVREVQSFERSLEEAAAGMRTALALHGVRVHEVEAGMQALTPGVLAPSSMIDAFVEVSRLAGGAIKNRQRLRFHHAAAEVLGRVVILEGEAIAAGSGGYVQLRLERPVVARRGDRFILRSYSPQHVIGGGRVLDPNPVKLTVHAAPAALSRLKVFDSAADDEVVATCAAIGGVMGFPASGLMRYGLVPREIDDACAALVKEGRVIEIEKRFYAAAVVRDAERAVTALIGTISAENKLLWGVDREELKERSGLRDGPLFDFLMERGRRAGALFLRGGRVRMGSGERELSADDEKALAAIDERVRKAGFAFATKSELLAIVRDERRLVSYLHILSDRGSVVRISIDGVMNAERYRELLEKVKERFLGGAAVSVGDFKELFGFSRKYAVPILEHLDREGYTRREGDTRKAGPKLV
jgi:selenocysteine-specific elongation factor